jgi:hypothetical protein
MTQDGKRMDPPDLRFYDENRSKFPPEELLKYAGKHVAFSPDGTRVLASGDDIDEVVDKLAAAGIHFSQVVHSYIDPV